MPDLAVYEHYCMSWGWSKCGLRNTSRAKYLEKVFENSRECIYGDKYKGWPLLEKEMQGNSEGQMVRGNVKESSERQIERAQENSEEQMEWEKFLESSERQMERAQYFESLNSLVDLKDFMLKCKRVFHYVIRDPGIPVELFNFSVSEDFRSSVLDAVNPQNWEKVESLIMPIAVAFPGRAAVFHAFFISAAVLLSMVYQYLKGVVDRGGGKTYSSGSLEFRSTYISIVLFRGAYVWIKFRDVRVIRKAYVNKDGVTVHRYEPRFRPRGSKKKYVSAGSYEEQDHAAKVYDLCAFYYGMVGEEGVLPLGDGTYYPIPPITGEDLSVTTETMGLDPNDLKRIRVGIKVKKVWRAYLDFLRCRNASVIPPDQDHGQHPPCGDGAPGQQPPDSSGAPEEDCGDGAWDEPPPNPSGAPDEDYGDGALGEPPPDPNGAPGEQLSDPSRASDEDCGDRAPGEQPPDPHRSLHAHYLMASDDLSLQREVEELRHENKLLKREGKRQNQLLQLQEQHYKAWIELREQHNKERIAELEDEVARLRSKECSCKRIRTSLA